MPTSMPKMLRPRQHFPTPLFVVFAPLLVAALASLIVYLAIA
jgi:hypothetical protein